MEGEEMLVKGETQLAEYENFKSEGNVTTEKGVCQK